MRRKFLSILAGLNAVLILGICTKSYSSPKIQAAIAPNLSTNIPVKLAKHLKKVGANFYGTYWCPACKSQMSMFGEEARIYIPYIECGLPEKLPDQNKKCHSSSIKVIPTWIIPGKERLEGVQSFETLSIWSDFRE